MTEDLSPPSLRTFGERRIELVRGNLAHETVDAIVNAANTKLKGGGGVDGALHRAAGPALLEACLALPADEKGRRCPTGECRTTGAGKLDARYVIHAVGPFYNERYRERAERLLSSVHRCALGEAERLGCASIAFPAISTGAYRFPVPAAAGLAIAECAAFLRTEADALHCVRFVLYKDAHYALFVDALRAWTPTGE